MANKPFTVTFGGMTAAVFGGEWTGDESLRRICELAMSDPKLFPPFEYVPDRDRNAAFVIADWLGGVAGPPDVPVDEIVVGRVY